MSADKVSMSLFAELRRRNVVRMAGLYLVGAWLLVQVASTLLPAFGVPDWVLRGLVIVLALGLVPALAFAWVFELTPDGLRRDADVPLEHSIAPQTARRMDRMIIAVLLLALTYFGFDKFVLAPRREAAIAASATASATKPAPAAPVISRKSIAVLPFSDLSPAHDQEYFSDGMAEEILNALAQVKDLKVAGRTSSFHFKGRNEDLREIGRTLGVAHILEGSVRKQGNRVRITAQLIQASDGTHLWSHAYDGELTDVFQLQENIARAITDQLQVVLEGKQKVRLVPVATRNPEAYSLYLQASAIFDQRDSPRFPDAIASLEKAIKLDPKYARAHSRLAALYVVLGSYSDVDLSQAQAQVLQHARQALALNPTLAEPYAAMGVSYGKLPGSYGFIKEREALDRALQLDPDDVTSNFWSGLSMIMTGYRKIGIAQIDHALVVDPMTPNAVRWRGIMYRYAGDLDRAEEYLKRARAADLPIADRELSEISFARGDATTAIRQWADGTRNVLRALPPGSAEIIAAGMYGDAAARKRALALVERFLAGHPAQVSGQIPVVLVKLGQPRRALELLVKTPSGDNSDFFTLMWSSAGKPLRTLPEFPAFLETMGFIELWEKYGPPDLCKRVAPREYACE